LHKCSEVSVFFLKKKKIGYSGNLHSTASATAQTKEKYRQCNSAPIRMGSWRYTRNFLEQVVGTIAAKKN
jgi:hypothetical protein